jgi:hypothetical protein
MGRPSALASSSSDTSLDITGDSMKAGLAYLQHRRGTVCEHAWNHVAWLLACQLT